MKNRIERPRRRDAFAILGLLAIILAGALPLLLSARSWQDMHGFGYDADVNYQVLWSFLDESYGQGRLPLWNPRVWGGVPGIGFHPFALLHPSIVFFFLESIHGLIAWNTISHLCLIGVFSFLLFRELGVSRAAALTAATWNALSGYGLWVSPIISMLNPLPWTLAWMWTSLGCLKRPRFSTWAMNALACALLVTSGESVELTYVAYLAGAWLALIFILSPQRSFSRLVPLLIAPILASVIAFAQFLPTIDFFPRLAKSSDFTWAFFRDQMPEASAIGLGVLGIFTKQFKALFLPVAVAVFAALGLRGSRKNPTVLASGLLLIGAFALLALGRSGPGIVLYAAPLMGKIVRFYKTGLFLQPLLMIVAVAGLDAFLERWGGRPRGPRLAGVLALVAIPTSIHLADPLGPALLATAGLMGVALAAFFGPGGRRRTAILFLALACGECCSVLWRPLTEFPRRDFWPPYCRHAGEDPNLFRVQVMYPAAAMLDFEYLTELPVQAGGACGGDSFDSFVTYPLRRWAELLAWIQPSALVRENGRIQDLDLSTPFKSEDFIRPENRALVDLLGIRRLFVKDLALAEADRFPIFFDPAHHLKPGAVDCSGQWEGKLVAGPEGEVPALELEAPARCVFPTSVSVRDRLAVGVQNQARGPDGRTWLALSQRDRNGERRLRLARALRAGAGPLPADAPGLAPGPGDGPGPGGRLEFAAWPAGGGQAEGDRGRVAWIDPRALRPEKTIRWREGGRLSWYENESALPRARIVHQVVFAADEAETKRIMQDPERYDPRRLAVVSDPSLVLSDRAAAPGADAVELVSFQNDAFELAARSAGPGLLVWAGNAYPGWRSWVDGREVKVRGADLALLAVPVPAGEHRVVFRFVPFDFRIGLAASLTSLVALAGLALVRGRRRPGGRGETRSV